MSTHLADWRIRRPTEARVEPRTLEVAACRRRSWTRHTVLTLECAVSLSGMCTCCHLDLHSWQRRTTDSIVDTGSFLARVVLMKGVESVLLAALALAAPAAGLSGARAPAVRARSMLRSRAALAMSIEPADALAHAHALFEAARPLADAHAFGFSTLLADASAVTGARNTALIMPAPACPRLAASARLCVVRLRARKGIGGGRTEVGPRRLCTRSARAGRSLVVLYCQLLRCLLRASAFRGILPAISFAHVCPRFPPALCCLLHSSSCAAALRHALARARAQLQWRTRQQRQRQSP